MSAPETPRREVPRFRRGAFLSGETFTRIGEGEIGGKAAGLLHIREFLQSDLDRSRFPGIQVDIPTLAVISTGVFETFMERNGLWEIALSDAPEDRIAHAFHRAQLPAEVLGDLRALVEEMKTPIAARSSSLLEDALGRPFAGVYGTKMVPNHQPERDARFARLVEAVKVVWASTFSRAAKSYIRSTGKTSRDERMAVVLQEVVGVRRGDRFYPDLSGVGRSWSYYPSGRSRPEDGVADLALGLGKTIVDGGIAWSYSPRWPAAPPPFASARDLLGKTQNTFWAVWMGKAPDYDPTSETEWLVQAGLDAAEYDGTLRLLASTYDAASDRLSPGTGGDGPRVLNFAPLLVYDELPLNPLVSELLRVCEERVGAAVEIEFALALPRGGTPRLGLLQVRPMVAPGEHVEVTDAEMTGAGVLVTSDRVMGNGVVPTIRDVVYVRPGAFEGRHTPAIAAELERLNLELMDAGRPYLLIGFGRWGSSDPWLGIPVDWGQICGAKAVVEATHPQMNVEPSQGSHFFHNISSFRVGYFFVHHERERGIDWAWLDARPAAQESALVRHVRLEEPLLVKVDGRTGRGVIRHDAGARGAGEAGS